MANGETSRRLGLDWTKLLGFDQVQGKSTLAQIGAKVGNKIPPSLRDETFSALGGKMGAKVGSKIPPSLRDGSPDATGGREGQS